MGLIFTLIFSVSPTVELNVSTKFLYASKVSADPAYKNFTEAYPSFSLHPVAPTVQANAIVAAKATANHFFFIIFSPSIIF